MAKAGPAAGGSAEDVSQLFFNYPVPHILPVAMQKKELKRKEKEIKGITVCVWHL